MTLASLMILIMAAGAMWIAWSAPREMAVSLRALALFASNNPGTLQLIITAVGGIAVLLCLLVLLAEVTPESKDDIQIRNVKGGKARISTGVVREKIIDELSQLEHIISVAPTVKSRGSSADIHVSAQLSSDSYQNEANMVLQTIRDSIEKDMGIKIRRLDATLTTKPLKDGRSTHAAKSMPQNEAEEVIIVPEAVTEEARPVYVQTDQPVSPPVDHKESVVPQENRRREP